MGASSQTEFYDDPTGFEFDADMVCRARDQEMRYLVGSLKVWSRTVAMTDIDGWRHTDPRSHGRHQQGLKRLSRTPIEGGGGGDKVPVGNRPPQDKAAVFPSKTPLVADRLLCSLATSTGAPTHTSARHAEVVMVFLDTSREARTLHTKLPEERSDHRKNRVGKLLGHLVGVREAGGLFELKVEETCVAGGAERGLQYPKTFKSGSKAPHRMANFSWLTYDRMSRR